MAELTPYPSASLLRRLAEAADGYRDDVPRIVIARRDPPHTVAGVFPDGDSRIDRVLAQAGPGYETFGPFLTPQTESFKNPAHDVVSASVLFASGERREYSAEEYDALIWSIPAFDKLVMPYLTSVSGFEHAARERAAFINGSLMPHSLYSF